MQRIVAATGELAVDGDEILHVRYLARKDDAMYAPRDPIPRARRARCRLRRRRAPRAITASAVAGRGARLRWHPSCAREARHRGRPSSRRSARACHARIAASIIIANGRSSFESLLTLAGLIRNLASARAHPGCSRSSVAVVVKVADERNSDSPRRSSGRELRNGRGGFRGNRPQVERARSGGRERAHLRGRRRDVRGVGVCHRPHDDARRRRS